MHQKPERLDKDGFPIPAGFDDVDSDGAPRPSRAPVVRRVLRWAVLAGLLTVAWIHFDVGTKVRNAVGQYLCDEAVRQYYQNDLQGALASLDRAVGWAPRYSRALMVRMQVHLDLRNWEEALEDSRRAAELEPSEQYWISGRLAALHALKRHRETATFCGEVLSQGNFDRDSLLNARAYARALGGFELEDGLADINKALASHPENESFIDTRGYLLLKLGRNKEALADFEKAITLVEQQVERLEQNAIQAKRKQIPLRGIERQLKQFDEGRAVMYHHRGEALEKLGQAEEARADFVIARELGFDEANGVY